MFNALLISPLAERLHIIKTIALETEAILLLRVLEEYPSGNNLNRLLNLTEPDVVLLDLSQADTALACADGIRAWRSDVLVVGFADSGGSQAAPPHRAHAALPITVASRELLRTVQEGALRLHVRINENLYAFMPGKAGSGSSTVIWHTATILAKSKRVLLIEGDMRSGALSLLLNTEPECSLQQLLRGDGERKSFLVRSHVDSSMNVDLLLSDRTALDPPPLWQDYFALLESYAPRYDVILVDLPDSPDPSAREILRLCGKVFLVTTPDIVSVQLTKRALTELRDWGIDGNRTRVLLNRWEEGELESAQLEGIFSVPVAATIPSDYRTLKAALFGSTALKPESEIARSLASFATRCLGAAAPAPVTKEHSLGGKLRSLFQTSTGA